jgi:hypothetical protein
VSLQTGTLIVLPSILLSKAEQIPASLFFTRPSPFGTETLCVFLLAFASWPGLDTPITITDDWVVLVEASADKRGSPGGALSAGFDAAAAGGVLRDDAAGAAASGVLRDDAAVAGGAAAGGVLRDDTAGAAANAAGAAAGGVLRDDAAAAGGVLRDDAAAAGGEKCFSLVRDGGCGRGCCLEVGCARGCWLEVGWWIENPLRSDWILFFASCWLAATNASLFACIADFSSGVL